MKLKDWVFTVLGTAILVALVVLITNSNGAKQPITSGTNNAGNDSMSSMHGGAPADSTIFNNLVGKLAPDFTLSSFNGDMITLSKLKGQIVILFFNEGLMCYPSCWSQVAAFGKDTELPNKNTVVLNITVDPKKDWQEAVGKMPELTAATVLLDTDKKVSTLYGVLSLPSSMHRGQFPGHSYVIIDRNGIVRFIHDDVDMAVRNRELANEISSLW